MITFKLILAEFKQNLESGGSKLYIYIYIYYGPVRGFI